ncbi:MAG TPA: phenylacetate--CoA ligase [Ktedonobacteraceae bacterium]|nr:phenylacetate--CoA ligase [Ktedonobacteraceae bacterium]
MDVYNEVETFPREKLRKLQDENLRNMVAYVYERVPFYRETFDRAGLKPGDIHSLDDLPKLPFTRKQDLKEHYPFGLLAVPREQVVRVHASSGTTGKATVVSYTRNDIDIFSEVMARSLVAGGGRPGMILHNAYGYGLFTGGLGVHYGGERLGMAVVPVSGGMTQRQITLILDFKPDVICCTPSYAQTLGEEFAKMGISPEEISLKYALLGAEPWTEAIRDDVDEKLGIRSTNVYGLSEIMGPGVSQECIEARNGSHIWEDHFYPEVVDPTTGEPLPDGKEGVLIFTHLTREAMPLLRYWTSDITYLNHEPCECGRTHARMGPIRGRTDDMLIVRGVNLYPTQVEEVLKRIPHVVPHYQVVVTRKGTLDEVEVKVELADDLFREIAQEVITDEVLEVNDQLRNLRNKIQHEIHGSLGLNMKITLMPPGTIPRSEGGKLKRSVDTRNVFG